MANQERNTKATDDAMSSSSDYNLYVPMDIIFDILNRLPVKCLLRFRCICKTFRHLISNPTFISSHLLHHRTTTTATIFTFKHRSTTSRTLLQSPSSSKDPNNLVYPFSNHTRNLHLIGSINGLLCLRLSLSNHPLHCHRCIIILLWNPATKLFKSLPSPTIQIPPRFFSPLSRVRIPIPFYYFFQ
ncbi:putative F-box protein At1g50870 [Camellia sinensis]|uniref:putative F-box protein At1g50870 n=1 Tax=Camellia sinensis TaxID=4442 RepID=UPI001035DD2C|nr:putative F-box protein At1g50870 [Camellia sinensis]